MDSLYSEYEIGISDIRSIVAYVKDIHDIDLHNYALSSLRRRIGIFISNNNNIKSIDNLIIKLNDNAFFETFLSMITVEPIEMFRDASFWIELKNTILPQFESIERKISIWVPNCSSCEELFTFNIVASESGILDKLSILATDITEQLFRKPKNRKYSLNAMLTFNEENYERYNPEGKLTDYYQEELGFALLNPELLNNVEFKVLNLVQNEPDLIVDLILCRNVLLYYNMTLRNTVLDTLCNSLNKGGYLILGYNETLEKTNCEHRFTIVNKSESIYRKI